MCNHCDGKAYVSSCTVREKVIMNSAVNLDPLMSSFLCVFLVGFFFFLQNRLMQKTVLFLYKCDAYDSYT